MDISAEAGKPFEISVEQLGTSGYQWHVEDLPGAVALVDSRQEGPPPGAPPGTAGRRVFAFRSDEPGRYEIVLASKRAWESQTASRRTFSVEVR